MLQKKNVVEIRSSRSEPGARLVAEFVTNQRTVKEAQRLRYEVFCEEYRISLPVHAYWNGSPIDTDPIDNDCLHLVVTDVQTGKPVGYTRVLTREMAQKHGRFYSAQEFDIRNIEKLGTRLIEIGRTCIHPDYRNGATIAVLWSQLAKFMQENNFSYLFGCASISLADGGAAFASIMPTLRARYLCEKKFRVYPKHPIKVQARPGAHPTQPPALLKAYMKMGAKICGEACWDPEFNVADLLVLLDLNQVESRYAKRFLKAS